MTCRNCELFYRTLYCYHGIIRVQPIKIRGGQVWLHQIVVLHQWMKVNSAKSQVRAVKAAAVTSKTTLNARVKQVKKVHRLSLLKQKHAAARTATATDSSLSATPKEAATAASFLDKNEYPGLYVLRWRILISPEQPGKMRSVCGGTFDRGSDWVRCFI